MPTNLNVETREDGLFKKAIRVRALKMDKLTTMARQSVRLRLHLSLLRATFSVFTVFYRPKSICNRVLNRTTLSISIIKHGHGPHLRKLYASSAIMEIGVPYSLISENQGDIEECRTKLSN